MTQPFTQAAFWDERFQGEAYAYGLDPNDFLREHAALFHSGARILSLAEGEGRNAVFLADRQCEVRCVDYSEAGRRKALELARKRGVDLEYDLADLTTYNMQQAQWDGVISIFCHLADHQRPALFDAVKQSLKPGGVFLMEAYNPGQLAYNSGGPKALSHLPSLQELNQAFSDYEIILARDLERDIHEGPAHDGLSSVVQFIARKLK